MNPSYKIASHTRFNDGTSSDLSQLLATHPGWLLSAEAFSLSSVAPAHLFIYDTTAAITTASIPMWQGLIPFSVFISGATNAPMGAGIIADLQGRTLNNGLAYAVSSNAAAASLSTAPASMVKVNLSYQTSSCL
ncbi:MAG: hypothetical protein V4532_12980 [Pseudomonadota bacterium]